MTHVVTTAAALAAALVMASGATAHAQTANVNDRSGDVWRATHDEADPYVAVNSPLNADIDRTRVQHGTRDLVLTTTYQRLARRDHAVFPIWTIRTGDDTRYSAAVLAGPGDWPGQAFFFTSSTPPLLLRTPALGEGLGEGGGEGEGECPGMTHDIDYGADTITISVPRTCLGEPERVRVRSTAQASSEDDESWYDNGHNRGHSQKGWTRLLHAG